MKKIFLLIFMSFSFILAQAQEYTLSGYLTDGDNGETLIGASIYEENTGEGTVTNEYGFYSITLPSASYTFRFSYLGYDDQVMAISMDMNKNLSIELALKGEELQEIIVVAEAEDNYVKEIQMSVEKLDIKTIQKLPSLLGEKDVIKSIQLLPGVSSVGEGAAGFNVRGGSIDQNLVILDEAPVYNSSHLFGFFSVFNPDAVKDVKLYKGGIPARYGGRLSSILDVRMKEGNSKQMEVNGGVGTIFSRLSVEGPLVKDKSSFVIAGRRSYIDVLAKPFLNDGLENSSLNFYDLTLKTNYKLSEKDQVFISGYFGRDNFGFGDNAGFNWGNKTFTTRWNHLFSDRLFANITAYASNYDYMINFGDTDDDTFDWSADIINYSIKSDFSFFVNPDNIIRFGAQSIYYIFHPADAISRTNGLEIDISLAKQYSVESSTFIEHELKLGNRFKFNYGLRLSHFAYLGGREVYTFGESLVSGQERPLISEVYTDRGSVVEDFFNIEPRFSTIYEINSSSSLKASYNRTTQYIHLLSNTTASTPVDIWTPSTNNIEPQKADQVALGYFKNLNKNTYEFSTEIYYKKMNDILDYIDGADLILNEYVEGQILAGEGRAYGAEFLLRKNKGKFSGWISYTLARTEKKVSGINKDDWYPSRFDKTHNFSITSFYDFNDRFSLSANFVFNTGTPTTLPTSRYIQQDIVVPHNSEDSRNNIRIPDYHRLDLSFIINPKKRNRRWEGQWVIGVYNVYNRRNAFSLFTKQQEERVNPGQQAKTDAIRLSVVGSFVPSISYNFTFK